MDRTPPAFETRCIGAGRLRSSFLRRPVALLLGMLAAVVLALAGQPVAVLGQNSDQSPLDLAIWWEDRYEESFLRYEYERAQFERIERDWNRLNDEFLQQRERNPASAERILGEIQQLSADRTRAQGTVRRAQQEWQDIGDSFIGAMDNYLEILNRLIQGTPLGDSALELNNRYRTWDERLKEVERDLAPNRSLELTPMPEVQAREDDTADELDRKADYLEGRARRDSAVVVDVDARIELLTKRQIRDRSTADLRARIARFGDFTVPVETEGVAQDAGIADSAEVDLTLTPEQQIEQLQTFRDEILARVDQLLERARELRAEAERRRM